MKKMESTIKQWLRERDIYFGKKVKMNQLAEFLDYIRPVTTEHKLVRIGDEMDGGYLLPDDFEGVKSCFSPGVSEEAHFEVELAKKGIRSFLADYSVDSAPIDNSMFDFEKKFLGIDNDSIYMTLESWVTSKVNDEEKELILEMDIEGSEYEVIFDTSNEFWKRFRILVIEFHNMDSLLDRYGFRIISLAFRKLLKHFDIAHIHPNNQTTVTKYKGYEFPSEMEFTFLRKDRVSNRVPTTQFPHKLDAKNMQDHEDLVLPKCWYGNNF